MPSIIESASAMIGGTIAMTWLASSCGTPLIASFYVDWLVSKSNVRYCGNGKFIDKETGLDVEHRTKLMEFMEENHMFPVMTMLGPFAIPFSLYHMTGATICYIINQNKKKSD
jgi:hypothetical protein